MFLALVLAAAAMVFTSAAANAEVSDELDNAEIAQLSDQEFIEFATDEGQYEVGDDGAVTVYDTRPLYAQAGRNDLTFEPMCIACVDAKWVATRTSGPNHAYGGWRTIASGREPGSLSRAVSVTEENSYSGTLSMSKSAVNAAVGFNITSSRSVTTTYEGNVASGKQGFLQIRAAYNKYTVKQQYYVSGKLAKTTWIYPKEYAFTDHRIKY